ncbi:MAG TPA: tyrosine-type recombinase/integrase [Tepidisphaeraceae bacterium]
MPKLSADRVPSYCRHKQSGQATVYLDGRQILLAAHGTAASREKYNRLIAEWMANGRTLPTAPEEVTILHVIARFSDYAAKYYRHPDGTSTGEYENFKLALRHLKRLYGRLPAADFGPLKLRALREEMIKPRKEKDSTTGIEKTAAGWSRTYANRQTSRLRHVFKWAAAEEMIPASVHHGLSAIQALRQGRTEARETAPVTTIPQAYVEAVVPFLSRQAAGLLELQSITGARGGELFKLRGCDIDTSKPSWRYTPASHKTAHHGHQRVIHFGPRAKDIITQFLKPNPQATLFSPIDAEAERRAKSFERRQQGGTPMSCGNRPGTNRVKNPKRAPKDTYNKHSYARAILRACDKADAWEKGGRVIGDDERLIPRWHPHQLRHNAATNFRRDYGLEGAQVMLGQKTMRITEMYAEKNTSLAERITAEVG